MKLPSLIALSGADDRTNIDDLVKLQIDYPNVEFGILLSNDRAGTPRYPSMSWLKSLPYKHLRLSFHFCGTLVHDIFSKKEDFFDLPLTATYMAERIQINYGQKHGVNLEALETMSFFLHEKPIILPYNQGNKKFIVENLEALKKINVQLLFDSSGGNGIPLLEIPCPIKGVYCGYAGGLSPQNVRSKLNDIGIVTGPIEFWIDAESSLRDSENKFSVEICREYLDEISI